MMKVAKGKRMVVFLDYDGTLSPIVDDPDRAFMSDEVLHMYLHLCILYILHTYVYMCVLIAVNHSGQTPHAWLLVSQTLVA